MSPRESVVECQNIYQVNQYDTPLSPWVFNSKTYIKCSQIHKIIQSDKNKISKGKLNSSQQDREGKTPYDLTILTKPTIHQDHDISRTREREREIKHIATGTNPQPRGWTTPSSSWWPPGWWRCPPVMISPSGRVPERAPERFLVATEACWKYALEAIIKLLLLYLLVHDNCLLFML